MTTVVAVVALALAGCCGFGWWRTTRRLRTTDARVARLERVLRDDVGPTLERARLESEEAVSAAYAASRVVGIETPAPRLVAETITGPVVRAVAIGAGARRALARLAADVTPMARARRNTVRIVRAASRARGRDARGVAGIVRNRTSG
jgi:hypothetical protein